MTPIAEAIGAVGGLAGVLAILLALGVVIVILAAVLSRNGIQVGKFRAGVRRAERPAPAAVMPAPPALTCLGYVEEHTKTLDNLIAINRGQQMTLGAVAAACQAILASMEGEKQNGNLRVIRDSLMKAEGYREAVAEGAK